MTKFLFQKGHKGYPRKGYKHSDQTKEKLKRTWFKKGHKQSVGALNGWYGKTNSEETTRKIVLAIKGKPLSEEHKKKISQALIGKKKKGYKHITPINKMIRRSAEYKLWRTAVFERDNYFCVWCGIKGKEGLGRRVVLNADHIKPFAYFPALRFAIDNGRTLCVSCHKKTDTYGRNGKHLVAQ